MDFLGSIQDKVTVCATDDSYQKARQSMAQAEEETRSRSAIVIKPGGRYLGELGCADPVLAGRVALSTHCQAGPGPRGPGLPQLPASPGRHLGPGSHTAVPLAASSAGVSWQNATFGRAPRRSLVSHCRCQGIPERRFESQCSGSCWAHC